MDGLDQAVLAQPDAMATDPAAYAPESEAIPSDGGEDQPDYAALYADAQRQAEEANRRAEAAAQREAAIQQREQQAAWQNAQAAWKQREQQMLQQTENFDEQTRLAVMQEFYNQRHQQTEQQAYQALQFVTAEAYAQDLLRANGLTQEDRILLGSNPNQMPQIAARIKAERDQHKALLAQIERGQRAAQAQQSLEAGINRIGGVGGRPAPVDANFKKGSPEHLKHLWNNPVVVQR